MIKLDLQRFGGRGGDGSSLSGGGNNGPSQIFNEEDVWSYRHNQNNEPFVDSINGAARDVQRDFPGLMTDVNNIQAGEFGGMESQTVLGCWTSDGNLIMNKNYTNVQKMNDVYDKAVQTGYHPSRGNKTGTEAVTYHELGHALTEHVSTKAGTKGIDATAQKIVNDAYQNGGFKGGTKYFASKISGYAKENYAECIAEAVADVYCNGSKAKKQSKAIMTELRKYK